MPKQRHDGRVGMRTCVACRQEAGKETMVRVVRNGKGGVGIDPTGHAAGRGAYLHRDPSCVEIAQKKRALDRALKTTVGPEMWSDLIPSPPWGEG